MLQKKFLSTEKDTPTMRAEYTGVASRAPGRNDKRCIEKSTSSAGVGRRGGIPLKNASGVNGRKKIERGGGTTRFMVLTRLCLMTGFLALKALSNPNNKGTNVVTVSGRVYKKGVGGLEVATWLETLAPRNGTNGSKRP